MSRRAAGLTVAKVRTAKPGRYGDGNGLYLFVRNAESRFWVFRYTPSGGKMREMGLGRAGGDRAAVTLIEARDKAAELYRKVRDGGDPLAERATKRANAVNFADVARKYIAAHEAGWRNAKHGQQWRNTLATYVLPVLGALPVGAVDVGAVTRVLEPMWREKPETASRVRGRIEVVLDYATAMGWRTGENPARWRGHLENLLPKKTKIRAVQHHAALPWPEIGDLMATLADAPGVSPLALRFLILTATRAGETLNATWGEIDLTNAIWTIPGERMKAGRDHRVPLSAGALAVLQEAARLRAHTGADAVVFPGGRPGLSLSSSALLDLLERIGRSDLTVHGLRSTFRDWCGEATNHPREVAEQALAHTVGNRVEAAYRRGDLFQKRRRLMEEWGAFCAQPAAAVADVIPIRA